MAAIQDIVDRGDLPSAPASTTSSGAVHPAIEVLMNPALRDLVVGFQTGYPFAVTKHATPSNLEALTTRGYNFVRRGVLAHAAVAAGDIGALERVYSLAQQPHYRDDTKLDVGLVMRCAVLFNRMDVLEWMLALKAHGCEWSWEPNLMGVAMVYAASTDLRVVEWINAHAPQTTAPNLLAWTYNCVAAGRLDLVQWHRSHAYIKITRRLIACAVMMGATEVLAYFYEHTRDRAKQKAVNIAAERGYLDTLKLVAAHQRRETTLRALNYAARGGKMDVVQFLLDQGTMRANPRQ